MGGPRLPLPLLTTAGLCTLVAVLVSTISILLQLRNYRKPFLQRMVVRIMVMVPLYAIASWISLFSVEAAFFIDAIRDVYEAFVIYCFFVLLLSYLGGERSLLILLHGRPPKEPVFPVNLFKREMDVSDPYTFLFLKRGILQYVQIKPALAIATMVLKAIGKFNEGDFRANSGYLYVSIIYNASICLALYCLAMFWVVVNDDLKPFRPVPKFLCVKGILFFSFWQSVLISALVATNLITRLGPYTHPTKVSVGLNDLLICIEMPLFAIAHNYAFSYRDFLDSGHSFAARMPMVYAFRDAFGIKDVVEDSKATLRGRGMDYRAFEPAGGLMHQGVGLENRIRAGLRYSKGGRKKYWLPKTTTTTAGAEERVVNKAINRVVGSEAESVHAPLLANQARDVVHLASDLIDPPPEDIIWPSQSRNDGDGEEGDDDEEGGEGFDLPFGDINEEDEELFENSKQYLFGDYNYPIIDVSSEGARRVMWAEEERVLRDERSAWFSPIRGSRGVEALKQREGYFAWKGYGAVNHSASRNGKEVGRFREDEVDERIIDHEQERLTVSGEGSSSERKDVAMRWTRHGAGTRTASPFNPATHTVPPPPLPHMNTRASHLPSPSSPISRQHSSRPVASSSSTPKQTTTGVSLPPDAVDLVVEDADVAEQMMERRRGVVEPALRAVAFRKVYRSGMGVEGEGEGEVVEVEDGVEVDSERRVVASDVEESSDPARQVYTFDDDHNPWA